MTTVLLALLLGWPLACGAEPAKMSKGDSLRAKPFADAKVVGKLAAGQTIDIRGRQGGWYQVDAAGKSGWVRMLSVRRTAQAAAASTGSLSQVATGRAGSGKIVATTGVRGLGEEQLREAVFSEEAVAAAERYRVSPADAERFAREGGVKKRQVPALPTPATGRNGSGS